MIGAHPAIESDDVDIHLVERGSENFRRCTKGGLAVHLDRHLGEDRKIGEFPDGKDRLFDDRQLGEGLENKEVDAALEQGLDLFAEHLSYLVERSRSEGFHSQTERSDRTGYEHSIARRLACYPSGGDVDLAKFALESVRLQFMS